MFVGTNKCKAQIKKFVNQGNQLCVAEEEAKEHKYWVQYLLKSVKVYVDRK